MVKRTLTFIVASLVVAHVSAAVPRCAERCTATLLAKEQAVRKALADPHMSDVVLKAVREVVAGYEAVVRHYPASSYSDDALWNAGRLELDAFATLRAAGGQGRSGTFVQPPRGGLSEQQTGKADSADMARTVAPAPAATRPALTPAAPVDAEPRERSAPLDKQPAASVATIKDVRRAVMADTVRITIELDSEVPFHDERISDPDRAVPRSAVDAAGAVAARSNGAFRRRRRHRASGPHRPPSEQHDAGGSGCRRRFELQRLSAVQTRIASSSIALARVGRDIGGPLPTRRCSRCGTAARSPTSGRRRHPRPARRADRRSAPRDDAACRRWPASRRRSPAFEKRQPHRRAAATPNPPALPLTAASPSRVSSDSACRGS